MRLLLLLLAASAARAAPLPPSGEREPSPRVDAAIAGARAEVLAVEGAPPACRAAAIEAPQPVAASGRVAVRVRGPGCDGWAWARVRVTAPALVTTRTVAAGEALEGATALGEREVAPGRPPLPALPEGARAARALPAGTALDAAALRIGPAPGEAVTVVIEAGTLTVEQRGTALPCRAGRACALLPSGRRVEGAWHAGRIVLGST